jgi:two-component system, OmpR family, response regulator
MTRKRILIVDDEFIAARLLKNNLEQTGRYEARVENWAEDAVQAAREFKPDLVLMDIIMPRMLGGNVAAAFGADPELQRTPIIFLTAAVKKSIVADHEGVISGNRIIAKPASLEEILRRIEEILPTASETG